MNFYLINVKTYSQHTVKSGSVTHEKLTTSNAKTIKIGRDMYKVFTNIESTMAYSAVLLLTGGAE